MRSKNTIIYGYTIAITIAFLGSGIGLSVGNFYQHKALAKNQQALQEQRFLDQLHREISQHLQESASLRNQVILGSFLLSATIAATLPLVTKRERMREQAIAYEQLQDQLAEKEQTEARLRDSERLYATLAQSVPVGIFRTDAQGVCVYVNQLWCKIVGITEAEAVGFCWHQSIHPDDRERVMAEALAAIQDDRPFQMEYRFLRPDESVIWTWVQTSPEYNTAGKIIGYVGTITTIDDRKQAETALQNLIEGTAATTGQDFFPALVRHIAEALQVSYALVTELREGQLHALAFWANGALQPTFAYPPAKTPCERALEDGQFYCEYFVQAMFPYDLDLVAMGVNSYLGIALKDSQNKAIGNLCVLDPHPIQHPQRAEQILRVFAARTAAELERQHANALLQDLNQALETNVAERTAELQHLSERLAVALKSGAIGYWEWTIQQNITVWDDRMYELYGLQGSRHLPNYEVWLNALHPDDRLITDQAVQAALRGDAEYNREFRIVHPNGQIRHIKAYATVTRDEAGNPTSMIGVNFDISNRKRLEEEQRRLISVLEQTNAELLRATRLKDEFLANMSHELRTPLNAILGMTEGLQEGIFGTVTDHQQKAFQTIERSGNHLLDLINDILDLAKIEAGELEIDPMPTAISRLCSDSLGFVRQQAIKKRINLGLDLPSALPLLGLDERRIRQVLINLLNNAVKFTPEQGSVTLTVRLDPLPETIVDACDSPTGLLRFSVTDTGIGIAPDNLEKLFQPFVQVDSALNRHYEGTGLGLALVKRIVELHGGTVTVSSKLGQGSCFTVRLPCSQTIVPVAPVCHIPSNLTHSPREDYTTTPLILLVEDNEANLITLSSYLQAKGYRLLWAKDGAAAITLAQAHQPDLIVMDIQMPGMDGIQATQQIRRDQKLVDIPILALTALAMEGDQERCLAAGANAYVTKPIKLKELTRIIQDLCTARSGSR